jgi:putative transposon-encoded protein
VSLKHPYSSTYILVYKVDLYTHGQIQQTMTTDKAEIEREVKEFGNGAHVVLPREFLGETVAVTPIEKDGGQKLQPPIQQADLVEVFETESKESLTSHTTERDNYPYEKTYQYDQDLRLKIDTEFVYEDQGDTIRQLENGRIFYHFTGSEAEPFVDESETEGRVLEVTLLEDDVAPILSNPAVGYGDWYRINVNWNGGTVLSAMFTPRLVGRGVMYLPGITDYASVEEYRNSVEYKLAVFLSDVTDEEYQTYINALGLAEDDFNSKHISPKATSESVEDLKTHTTAYRR